MNTKINIVILGAGDLGLAMDFVLQEKPDVSVVLWDKDTKKVLEQKPLSVIVPSVDFLFVCVPSWFLRDALSSVVPYISKETIVIYFAKGIEMETSKMPYEIVREVMPDFVRSASLMGPMLAEELMQGKYGMGMVVTEDKAVFSEVSLLFSDTKLRITHCSDVSGAAYAGVLKNMYAIGLGIVDGLKLGGNTEGWYVREAVDETAHIIEFLGGKRETAYSLAGLGDLVATGFSPYSRNRQTGKELIDSDCCLEGEGFVSLPALLVLLGDRVDTFPVLYALHNIMTLHKNAKEVFDKLIMTTADT